MRGRRRKWRNLPERRPPIPCGYWRMRCCIIGAWVPLAAPRRLSERLEELAQPG